MPDESNGSGRTDEPDESGGSDQPRDWAERRIEQAAGVYEGHGRIFRWMWIAVGFIIVAAGIAMIVFPGPVTVVVPLGLAMLAVVFGWARRLLLQTVEHGTDAARRFRRSSTWVKVLTMAASACVAGAAAAWFFL